VERIVVFSTSDIQEYTRNQTLESTGKLEKALSLGFTVYVVTTREKFSGTDEWWLAKVNRANVLTSTRATEDDVYVNSPGTIAPWVKLYTMLGIPVPPSGFTSWTEARDMLADLNLPDRIILTERTFRHYP
jgi:hypothetical protein